MKEVFELPHELEIREAFLSKAGFRHDLLLQA